MPAITTHKWKTSQFDVRAEEHVIVKLTDGTDTWYFSDIEMELTDGHVYGLLKSLSSIATGVDFFSRRWMRPELKIKLSNLPYRKKATADDWHRLEGDLKNLHGTVAEIYFMRGRNTDALTDCLKRFTGRVIFQPEYTEDTVTVTVFAADKFIDVNLPQKIVSEDYSSAVTASLSLKQPIVYGEFKYDDVDKRNDLGLAVTILLAAFKSGFGQPDGEYLISDHVLAANTHFYLRAPLLGDRVLQTTVGGRTLLVNDGGNGTAELTSIKIIINIFSDDNYAGDFAIDGNQDALVNPLNAADRNPSTYASCNDFIDEGTGPTDQAEIIAYFSFPDLGTGEVFPTVQPGSVTFPIDFEFRLETEPGVKWDAGDAINPTLWLYHNINGSDARWELGQYTDAQLQVAGGTKLTFTLNPNNEPTSHSWRDNVGWHMRSGWVDAPSGTSEPALVVLVGRTNDNTDQTHQHDGTVHNQNLLRVYEAIIHMEQAINVESLTLEDCWSECKGREYGSWISSRGSNYAVNNAIEDPAGIIESILRDELGLVDAALDLPTFVTSENASVKSRINLFQGNQLMALDAVRQIVEQSTAMFLFGADGIARMIDLTDKTPNTDRVIPYSHIKNGQVRVSKTSTIRNKMSLQSRWREEVSAYSDVEIVEDTTSTGDSKIGDRKYSASWPNIAGASKDVVAASLVNNTDGIWSKQHEQIDFETLGMMHADLLEGDWIELDAPSTDHHLLFYGASWSSVQFLILRITQGDKSTKIKAVKVW